MTEPRVELVPLSKQPVMPWQNGGGVTRQVAIDPLDGSLQKGFRWRVSVAKVGQGGPFSLLPMVDRSLWLVAGNGMRLAMGEREVVLDRSHKRLDFDGGTKVFATLLDGPCEDCNVMTVRGEVQANASMVALQKGEHIDVETAPQRLALVFRGVIEVGERAVVAGSGDAVRIEGEGEVRIAARTECELLVVRFLPAQ